MFQSALEAGTTWAVVLAVIAALNSVIAFFYYSGLIREMWFKEPVGDDLSAISVPPALAAAIGLTSAAVVVVGVYPQLVARVGELATRINS